MNILYLNTHDTGRYIQPYGHAVPTPNLMKLAEEGILFRQAYCAAPTCSPSRAALLTGMAAHTSGMLGLAHAGFSLNDYSEHLVQFLIRNGYETVLSGVQHEAPNGNSELIGYQKIISKEGKHRGDSDLDNAHRMAEYINQPKDRPFFASLGLFHTHRGKRSFPGGETVNSDYVMPPYPLFDSAENRQDMAGFIPSAAIADQCIGIVLDALAKSEHAHNTIVIFTTDHGIPFPHMKCNLYDTGIGVSLILKAPDMKQNGTASDALVSHIDLFPTLCDLVGLKKPERLQGVSLLPLMEGWSDSVRQEVFAEVSYHASYEPKRCIRTDRYKLIRFFDDYDQPVLPNIDDSLSKDFLLKHDYQSSVHPKVMLFDLYLDPVERENRAEDPAYQSIHQDLSDRLIRWMKDTDDPLLNGTVPKPDNAIVHSKTSNSVDDKIVE